MYRPQCGPMARNDTFPLIDRLVPGGLKEFLSTARGEGESCESIAYTLRHDHDIVVSTETVRKWCHRVGAERTEASA